jgi:uncharacterized protein
MMRWPGRAMVLVAWAFWSAPAQSQSFDCAKASTRIEHAICNDQVIGGLDTKLAQTFKGALAGSPEKRKSLLAEQRQWLAQRDKTCVDVAPGTEAAMLACLDTIYRNRISQLQSMPARLATDAATASCRKIAERYRRIADAHQGEPPLEVIAATPGTGVTTQVGSLGTVADAKQLADWAAHQTPPFEVPPTFAGQVDGMGSWDVERLANTNYYSLSQTQGTAHCVTSIFFRVIAGHAQLTDSPPGFSDEDGGACMVGRSYGQVDSTPVLFEQDYTYTPQMTASIKVASWEAGDFAGSCTVDFLYEPAFSRKTLNNWEQSCQDTKRCDGLREVAFQLAALAQNDSGHARAVLEQRLSPQQRASYEAARKGAPVVLADEQGTADDDEALTQLPVVYQDGLYLATLGHFTIGWREFADWSVRFDMLQDGKLAREGSFAVGMTKGKLSSATAN